MTDEKTRYNDAELEEFRILIEQKLESARNDYEMLRMAINNENDTEDSSPTFKVLEEGATTLSREEYGSLAQRQAKFIRNLELALVRIKNKTYGVCKTIPPYFNSKDWVSWTRNVWTYTVYIIKLNDKIYGFVKLVCYDVIWVRFYNAFQFDNVRVVSSV